MDCLGAPPQASGVASEPLRGLLRADAVIVGGGLTGLTTAVMLSRAGLRVILLEARQAGCGASSACSGTVSCLPDQAYQIPGASVNMDSAKAHAGFLRRALLDFQRFIQPFHQRLQACSTALYVYAFLERDLPALDRLIAAMQALDVALEAAPDAGGCPFPVARCALLRGQLTLSPSLYLAELLRMARQAGCVLAEHTPALDIDSGIVQIQDGTIHAPFVIVATGAPAGCMHPATLSLLQARVQACRTLSGGDPVHAAFLSVRDGGLRLHPLRNALRCGWSLGRAGEDHQARMALLERVLQGRLPAYATMDECIRQDVWSLDGLPLIGSVPYRHGPVLMASGFNGSGIVGSFLAAQVILRQILGQSLPEDALYHPGRTLAGKRLVSFSRIKPQTRARLQGVLRPRTPRCPHMGCRMRYSHLTKRWECPCHGSSFTVLGQVRDAPALAPAAVSARDRPLR